MNLFDYICTINISIPQLFFMRIVKAIFLVIFLCALQHCYCQKDESVRKAHGKIGSYAYSLDSLNKKKELAKCDSLVNILDFNYANGNYSEAIRLGQEVVGICEKIYGKEHLEYAASISILALLNKDTSNYSEAIKLGLEALQIEEKTLGKGHPDYAKSLSCTAAYYAWAGNYSKAIILEQKALRIYDNILGKENEDYSTSLSNLALYYSGAENYLEAIRLELYRECRKMLYFHITIRGKTQGKLLLQYASL